MVKNDYQHQGIGDKLHQRVIDYVQSLGHQKLYLLAFDENIVEWYKKLGWITYKTVELNRHSTTIMEFRLSEKKKQTIISINHITLAVKNIDRSFDFSD